MLADAPDVFNEIALQPPELPETAQYGAVGNALS
jgi:hypothetical protein